MMRSAFWPDDMTPEFVLSSCTGKVSFATYHQAAEVCERGSKRGKRRQVYHCSVCHLYHLGHPPKILRLGRIRRGESRFFKDDDDSSV